MARLTGADLDDILYGILSSSSELKDALSGGIYIGERPDDSGREDIVVNCLTLNRDMPQSGTSNVNVHVPDMMVRIGQREQFKPNRERLRTLTMLALAALEGANPEGISLWVSNETVIREIGINESYNNIRIEWNISRNA